jgi:succinyl-CoA synthetase alpha subunit
VFNTVKEAVRKPEQMYPYLCATGICSGCIMEAVDAGIKVIITITEGIPVKDMMTAKKYLQNKGVC